MLLPVSKLKGFLYFQCEYQDPSSKNNYIGYDIVKVYRSKKFLFFSKEICDVYTFRRYMTEQDDGRYWNRTSSCTELEDQLKAIQNSTWTYVPTDVYNDIREKFPDLVI